MSSSSNSLSPAKIDQLFAFGSNGHGQLGIGSKDDTNIPTRCILSDNPKNFSPKYITGGGNHSAIITHDGELWISGLNNDGQCGPFSSLYDNTMTNDSSTTIYRRMILPEELRSKMKWRHVACGWAFTVA
ncbi:6389_t:CDS:1, partial [Acaulospora morrowiae]